MLISSFLNLITLSLTENVAENAARISDKSPPFCYPPGVPRAIHSSWRISLSAPDGRTCTMRFDRLESTHNACINPLTIGRLYLLVWCACAALNGIMNRISTGTSSPWIYLDILCPELCRLGVPHASSRATGPFESSTHDKSANRTQASLGGC